MYFKRDDLVRERETERESVLYFTRGDHEKERERVVF